MSRSLTPLLVALVLTLGHAAHVQAPRFPSHPEFKPTPEPFTPVARADLEHLVAYLSALRPEQRP